MKRGGLLRRQPLRQKAPLEGFSAPLARSTPLKRASLRDPAATPQRGLGSSRSGPPRRGIFKTCQTCGRQFYAKPSQVNAKFCSRACMGFQFRKARTCTICGKTFFTRPRQGPRKTCSTKCHNEGIRRSKLGRLNPQATDDTEARQRWHATRAKQCAWCGGKNRLRIHHVVYAQHVQNLKGDVWEPANGLTLCWDCHNRQHHTADQRLPVSILSHVNVEFAFALLGDAAFDYFNRYYENDRWKVLAQRAGVANYTTFVPRYGPGKP